MINLLYSLGRKAAKHRREALGPFFASPEELAAAETAYHKPEMYAEYLRSVVAARDKLNVAEYTHLTTVSADAKCSIFGSALPTGRLHFGHSMLTVEAPGEQYHDLSIRYEKSVALIELKPQAAEQPDGDWIVTLTIKKEKVDAERKPGGTANRLIVCRADVSAAIARASPPRARIVRLTCAPPSAGAGGHRRSTARARHRQIAAHSQGEGQPASEHRRALERHRGAHVRRCCWQLMAWSCPPRVRKVASGPR